MADPIRTFQGQLLAGTHEYLLMRGVKLSPRVSDAFYAVPRHLFVERYRYFGNPDWQHVDESNLLQHLPAIYRDDGLGIAGLDGEEQIATISVPSMVLFMLELLQLEPGHRVFEVGAGSGWNAGLMGHLVGPTGSVESVEIIPELARRATRAIARAKLENVRITHDDAGQGSPGAEPYDRVVFTAGAYDIPGWMHDRVRPGGLLLMVLKLPGGRDVLILFRRRSDHFESMAAYECEFVPMTGAGLVRELDSALLEEFPAWPALRDKQVRQTPFWWGAGGRAGFASRTFSLRSFLAITEPRMRGFIEPEGWPFYSFGLWDDRTGSLALARDGSLTAYGNTAAADALLAKVHEWVDLGMPSALTMKVRAFRSGQAPSAQQGEYRVNRPATDFLWTLGA